MSVLIALITFFVVSCSAIPAGAQSLSGYTTFYNIADFGAKCDGSTNDNAAINAALTAAAASPAYQNNNAVSITGPSGPVQKGCVINSLNFTQFNKGNQANTRPRVEFYGLTLLCTGSGNICIDGLNAQFLNIHDLSLRGDSSPNSPEIGIQIGVSTAGTSSAWHVFERVNVNGEFALANFYNGASETFNCIVCYFTNAHSSNGPIGSLGSVTGGASYTNGTYTNVPLTGGSGTGALAKVVVSGGAVATVTITYEGRDYVPADVLSAAAATIGGTGSGFSVPVSTVSPYAVIMDGQNHWRVASTFTSVTLPTETWTSFTGNKFFGGSIRQNGAGKGALWAGRTEGMRFYQTYFYGGAAASSYCIVLFDNAVSKVGLPVGNSSVWLETANCEGGVLGAILLTGGNATHTLIGFNFFEAIDIGAVSRPVIAEDVGITSVVLQNANLRVDYFTNGNAVQMFKTPSLYTITGNVALPATGNWGSPLSFSGQLCTAASCVSY